MQRKLDSEDAEACLKIVELLYVAFDWKETPEGGGYWSTVSQLLHNKGRHGTSDGKPWVEPEPEIPEGYRKAEPDEWERTDVKYWSLACPDWRDRPVQGRQFDQPSRGTRYIVPVDPPLTDRDAAQWPRLLVMVRDNELKPWIGPVELQGVAGNGTFRYVTNDPKTQMFGAYRFARRATNAEIEAAK